MMIHLKSNGVPNRNRKGDDDPYRLHTIIPYLRDEEYQLINKPEESKCAMQFEDQTLYLHVKNKKVWLAFKDKKSGRENLKHCFDLTLPDDYFTEDHDSYIFLSAFSGEQLAM